LKKREENEVVGRMDKERRKKGKERKEVIVGA